MKYTFQLRGKAVTVAPIRDLVAVLPTSERRAGLTRSKLAGLFGTSAADNAGGGGAGLVLPARNRKLFESAGWLFVEPQQAVARAAVARAAVDGADAVRQVYIGRSGTLVGTDCLTVGFPPDVTDAQAKARIREDGLRVVRRLDFAGVAYEVRIPTKRPELEVVQELQASGRYLFVEPVFLEALTGRLKPTDPRYGDQWQHANSGANGGAAGADIRSEAAWDKTLGAGVRVAVIDNGMQVAHPDLKAGVVGGGYFQNGGTAGNATFLRWAPGQTGFPDSSHGTSCLGMAGARHNNGKGGCGSAPASDLIAVACLGDQIGTQLTLARAVAYAADPTTEDPTATAAQGAHVIACSLGPNGADWEMTSVLDLAITRAATLGRGGLGVPILWAATNGPYDIAHDEVCSHRHVLAVSRSNRLDLEDGAGYGDQLAFLAPGVDVLTTVSSRARDGFVTGCSFAAPLAAGVAALVLARYPAWTRDQVAERLFDSCDKVGGVTYLPAGPAGRHAEYGYGRINAKRAVQ